MKEWGQVLVLTPRHGWDDAVVSIEQPRDSQPNEPGWWFASDGRWYPPEAWPGTRAHRPRRGVWVTAAWVGAGFVLILIAIAIVVVLGRRDNSQLPKLRRASEQLTVPATWTMTARVEEPGSSRLCIISCPHASITLDFRVLDEPGSACATLRAIVDRDIAPTQEDPYSGCGWRAPVPGAGSSAAVWAGAFRSAPNSTDVTVWFSGVPT